MKKHLDFRSDDFWKNIPLWKDVTRKEFSDHKWQLKNSVTKISQIKKLLGSELSEEFYNDLLEGQKITPMNIRITPYVFSLINWKDPYNDPLRKQFLPIGSQFLDDHPMHMAVPSTYDYSKISR
jgi:lysine 2,3-aminomutase